MKRVSEIRTFKAFHSRNYTLYFIGRAVSQLGTWMQRTAVVWVVYSITHSPFMIGLTLFAEQFPSFLLSVLGGVATDRYNRYTIIRITQIASLIQATLLAILVLTNHFIIWEILVLSVMLGIINAFDVPARQSMIYYVLEDEADLPNAISLTASMASLAKLLGPALAGVILKEWGADICFLLNAASFGAVIFSLALMKLPAHVPNHQQKKVLSDLAEGFIYIKKKQAIGLIILMISLMSLLVLPYDTLIPVFAKIIFKGDASTFGYISAFIGMGAVIGTVFLASLKSPVNLRKLLFISMLILGAGLIAFSQSSNFVVAMVFAILIGFSAVAQNTITNIIVQSESAPQMRGRTISIMLMAMFGMLPLGSLIVGAISEKIGSTNTILCQGITAFIIAAVFYSYLQKQKQKPAASMHSVKIDQAAEAIIEEL
jgi:MFS family permease